MNDTIIKRQRKELTRLKKIYKNLPEDKLETSKKLIERIAFMLVNLEEMESRINADGLLVEMSQGKYSIERAHPLLAQYNAMVKNYCAAIKQLNEFLPPAEADEAGKALMLFATKKQPAKKQA